MSEASKRHIRAVLFDLDDTLIDWSQPALSWSDFTRPMVDNIYTHLRQRGYKPPSRDAFFACMQKNVQAVWEEAKEDWSGPSFATALERTFVECELPLQELNLEEIMRVYDWQPMPGVELFPDALQVLAALRQDGYRLGLITNSFYPMWMRDVELKAYQLLDYFDARTTSADAGYMKPHPGIYEHLLAELGVAAAEAVFVGDRPVNDIAGANEAGLISVLIDPPHLQRELDGVRPDYTITTLSQLLPILAALEETAEPSRP